MQSITDTYTTGINAPVRQIKAKAEVYTGSTLSNTYTQDDSMISLEIQRIGEDSKFFGIGICQRLNLHLRDKSRAINITTDNIIKAFLGIGDEYMPFPTFYVTEVNRDENTNELSITAYDLLDVASKCRVDSLSISNPYTIQQFAIAIATKLGTTLNIINVPSTDTVFSTSYTDGANFGGNETLREALTRVAEATQTICYVDGSNKIIFKRLDASGEPSLTVNKPKYFTLKCKDNKRISKIVHTTELGDNAEANTTEIGSTQYIRDNPFLNLRNDVTTLLNNAIANIGGLTINQFECEWRGNPALEVGDKIALTAKDNATAYSYILDDTISYDGTLTEHTKWQYTDSKETEDAPASVGDTIRQTVAKVDKVNQEISLKVAKDDLISEINQSAEQIKIKANKISLEGIATVNGGNFSVTEEGDVSVKGNVSADTLNVTQWGTLAKMNANNIEGGDIHLGNDIFLADADTTISGIYWGVSNKGEFNANTSIPHIRGWSSQNVLYLIAGNTGIVISEGQVRITGELQIGDVLVSDFVQEQGTSDIWTYRKWNSGMLEQWAVKEVTFTSWSSWSGWYYGIDPSVDPTLSHAYPIITFGIPFLADTIPTVSATSAKETWSLPILEGITNSQFQITAVRPTAGPTTENAYGYGIYAVGKWK